MIIDRRERQMPVRRAVTAGVALIACTALGTVATGTAVAEDRPDGEHGVRLVLQITVDQLRGDMPSRWMDRMGDGGFRKLMSEGIVYADAHHRHANTETIVGHATLATGADPAIHGMVGNVWFDRAEGRYVYNVEDAEHPLLSADAGVSADTEIDPTQRTARSDGRSPSAILVSTISDELALRTNGRAKVFGVSVKDRGAISMAGHAGKAFWFSKAGGEFVTSRYYYDAYPEWVTAWNATKPAAAYANTEWKLTGDRSTYELGAHDDQPWEADLAGFGRAFPHPYGAADGKYFTTLLTVSPAGDELVAAFTKELMDKESLGDDDVPDYLSVSFSSTDYVGHLFGPSSLESEDNLLRLDRTLADLLAYVDERVGLDRTLVVLSADHGAAEVPDHLREFGIPAQYFDTDDVNKQPRFAALREQFGLGEELIESYGHPYLNLDREAIEKAGLDLEEVASAVAAQAELMPGIAHAVSSADLAAGRVPDTPVHRQILRNHHHRRSGDIYVVFEAHWMINDFDGLTVASTHGSPWSYDTFVPVIFAGAGLDARRVHRRVHTIDVAPTIAAILGTKPPSGATGVVLPEVLGE
jgi:predicted AlkP superfamily pyrophosphatase or phosphodiesterase